MSNSAEPLASRPAPGPRSAPLGPGSLTHRTFSDLRMWLMTQRTGTLQAMHPVVAQALDEHSDLLENPMGRLLRSAAPVLGVVLDPESERTGTWVRDMHRGIRGPGYHSLHPEVFFWTHATFFESQIAMRETFGRPCTRAELDQLYAESVTWWRRYGLTDRVVPRDWPAFERYWDRMVADVLEPTAVVRAVLETPASAFPPPAGGAIPLLWPVLSPVIVDVQSLVLRGTVPQSLRDRLELPWTTGDRRRLDALAAGVRASFGAAPPALRRHPWDRSRQTLRRRAETARGLRALRFNPTTPRARGHGTSETERP